MNRPHDSAMGHHGDRGTHTSKNHDEHGQCAYCSTNDVRDSEQAGASDLDENLKNTTSSLKDPVCGMTVAEDTPFQTGDGGDRYYFCSESCLQKFEANPERYAGPHREELPNDTPDGAIYTCPMHPEIRQDHPGHRPKCGMALEPLVPETGR